MNLATLTILGGLALGAFAAPTNQALHQESFTANPAVVALEVPGTQYRGTTPSPLPIEPLEPTLDRSQPGWDDTADTSDELKEEFYREVQIDDPRNSDAELDVRLRNNPDDALFEDSMIEPVPFDPKVDKATNF